MESPMISRSFLLGVLVDALFLLLSLDFAVLLLIFGLVLGGLLLVLLVFDLKTVLGGLVDVLPEVADDLGDFGDLGRRVLRLNAVVHFCPVEEKGREGPFGSRWLR